MYYSGVYYGNNDYRDYIAHWGIKGMSWDKPVKYLKKIGDRYIYPAVKKAYNSKALKDVTGGYYQKQAQHYQRVARSAEASAKANASGPQPTAWRGKHPYKSKVSEANRTFADAQRKIGEANRGYKNSLKGRFESAYSKARKRIGEVSKSIIDRGKSLFENLKNRVKVKMTMLRGKLKEGSEAEKKRRRGVSKLKATSAHEKKGSQSKYKSVAKYRAQGNTVY